MSRIASAFGILAITLALQLSAAPAEAESAVTWVSSVNGNNNDGCGPSPASPCLTLSQALNEVYEGGEIRCIDGLEDSIISISSPVTIDCTAAPSTIYGLGGSAAITVNMDEGAFPNGVVTLRGLTIDGQPDNGIDGQGSDGIKVTGGGSALHIEDCKILGFTEQGIDFRPTSSVNLFVRNTVISNNADGGVFINPAAAASSRASLSDVYLDSNGSTGLAVTKSGGAIAAAMLDNVESVRNGGAGIQANGAGALVHLNNSVVTGNSIGLRALSGGQIVSYKTNAIRLNSSNGAPTSVITLQ